MKRCLLCGDPQQPSEYMYENFARLDDRLDVDRMDWRADLSPVEFRDVTMDMEALGPGGFDASGIEDRIDGVEVLVVHKAPVSADLLAAGDDLEVVGAARGGYENVDVEAAADRGVTVLHAPGRNRDAVADYAISLLLSRLRGVPSHDAAMKDGQWNQVFDPERLPRDLSSLAVGVVGFGNIGRAVARRAAGFDATVLAHDPYVDDDEIADRGAEPVGLDDLLGRADVVTLHVRLSDETRGLIGADAFERMQPSAILVNTARGGLVDEDALVDALREGTIAGAALDVFREEPLPDDHPLLGLDEVVLSPHVAGSTRDAVLNGSRLVAEGVEALLDGDEPEHRVV